MLIIILSWVLITVLVYPLGLLFHAGLERFFHINTVSHHFSLHCITGLMVTSFLATLLCLFIPLGLVANLFLLGITIATCVTMRGKLMRAIRADKHRLLNGHWFISLLFIMFVLIMAYLSYLPSSHYDDGLYYSTSIKWLQEYGTVKGIANVNPRIGFNTSWHILQANFGFQYLHLGLFNDMNGLLLIYMLLYSVGGINALAKGDRSTGNAVRAMIMMPALLFHFGATSDIILFNINFLGSSTADIPACLLTWLIFTLYIQKNVGERLTLTDILVVLYSTWVLSIKLSSVPILLLGVHILVRMIVSRKVTLAFGLVFLCIIAITPWLIRNVLITGYLVFPFSTMDLFPVDWKLPLSEVKWHENAVRAFATGADLNQPFSLSLMQWLPAWFNRANFIQQVSIGTVVFATLCYLVVAFRQLFSGNSAFFSKHARKIVCVLTCFGGILFWLFKAPDFRFGYGFICFYCIFFLAILCRYFLEELIRYVYVPVCLYMFAVVVFYYNDRWMNARMLFGKPIPYRMPQTMQEAVLPGNVHMNIVTREDSWNAPLPVANQNEYNILHPVLRGTTIRQGFKSKKEEH